MNDFSFDPENTLAGRLGSMSPREVIELGVDLCAAVETALGADGCHGGIWPGNVTRADNRVFVGPAEQLDVKQMRPDALEYIAPEQFWNGETTPRSDVYSIGLIMYTALNGGVMPFSEGGVQTPESRAVALQARMRGKRPPYPRTASRELGDIVLRAMDFHKEKRFGSPAELRQALLELPEGAEVDKGFEESEPPKPKKEKPVPEPTPEDEERDLEEFRKPKKKMTWLIPVVIIAAAAVAAVLLLRGCDKKPLPVETDPVQSVQPVIPPSAEPTVEPTVEPTPEQTPEPTETPVSEPTYQVVIEDVTWEQAASRCESMGGHLATVRSQDELDAVIKAVEESGARFFWLGAYRGGDGEWYYIDGTKLEFAEWDTNEPSAYDGDGTPENYMLMWKSRSRGIWCFNDTRNDPISVLPKTYSGKTAYVCQFD